MIPNRPPQAERSGLLFSSGLIAEEALVGILLAIPFAYFESTNALNIVPPGFGPYAHWLGGLAAIGFMVWLYRVAVKK